MQSNIKQKGELPYQITTAKLTTFYKEMLTIILVAITLLLVINLIK